MIEGVIVATRTTLGRRTIAAGRLELELLGVGAMRSPRNAPAGLRVRFDGGPGAAPPHGRLDAWLVTDEHCELIAAIRAHARKRGLEPNVARWEADGLVIRPRPVVHTSHAAFGYLIEMTMTSRRRTRRCAWAPEFFRFPRWAAGVDLMFAEASSFARPVRFAGGVGGHMAVIDVAREAERNGVRRLIFAHIGKSSIRAREAGAPLSFGEWASDGDVFVLGRLEESGALLIDEHGAASAGDTLIRCDDQQSGPIMREVAVRLRSRRRPARPSSAPRRRRRHPRVALRTRSRDTSRD